MSFWLSRATGVTEIPAKCLIAFVWEATSYDVSQKPRGFRREQTALLLFQLQRLNVFVLPETESGSQMVYCRPIHFNQTNGDLSAFRLEGVGGFKWSKRDATQSKPPLTYIYVSVDQNALRTPDRAGRMAFTTRFLFILSHASGWILRSKLSVFDCAPSACPSVQSLL